MCWIPDQIRDDKFKAFLGIKTKQISLVKKVETNICNSFHFHSEQQSQDKTQLSI